MNEFLESIHKADEALNNLRDQIIKQFNVIDTGYEITFKGKTYDFYSPITQEEKKKLDKEKKEITKILLRDAFRKFLLNKDMRTVWFNISLLQRMTRCEFTTATIVSEEYEAPDEGTSRPLNTESIYAQLERKDLSDEEKWYLILGNFEDKGRETREIVE